MNFLVFLKWKNIDIVIFFGLCIICIIFLLFFKCLCGSYLYGRCVLRVFGDVILLMRLRLFKVLRNWDFFFFLMKVVVFCKSI